MAKRGERNIKKNCIFKKNSFLDFEMKIKTIHFSFSNFCFGNKNRMTKNVQGPKMNLTHFIIIFFFFVAINIGCVWQSGKTCQMSPCWNFGKTSKNHVSGFD